ncbi:MAG: Omp28-related outer membrane protein, partial [Bacteroidales bacterium]|nr:Omp28-related outer membrane protein [Bacteroidales bacterium]
NTQLTVSIVDRVATISTPNENWNGSETITFRATDPGALWDDDAVTFTVTAVNDFPVVTDIPNQTIAEGASFVTITLDNYVSDPDNTDAQISWTAAGNTQLIVNISAGRVATITTPSNTWNGSETITFTATDPGLLSDSDQAIFTVTSTNDPPVVDNIPNQTIVEGSNFATISLDNYVSDPDHRDNQIIWSYSGNTQLSVSINANRIATIVTPSVEWFGSETITFTATDPLGATDSDPASFTVTFVNDSPVLTGIPNQIINEGSTFETINLDEYVSDPDHPDNQLTLTVSGNTNLTVLINPGHVATITVPNADWYGSETLTFTATDPLGASDSDVAVFTVTSVNDPPVVSDIGNQTITEGGTFNPISLDNFVTDPDHADNQITWTASGNTQLIINISANRIATITTPSIDWNGSEAITFTARDPLNASASDQALFTVTGVNDPPVATNVSISPLDQRIGITNAGSFTFTDPDGDLPGLHQYRWYRATNSSGTDLVVIAGATSNTYRPVKADGARYICFEVTPVDQYGLAGVPVRSAFKYINNSPVASNVQINAPSTIPGATISASFTYSDTESNLQDNAHTIYRWYRTNVVNPSPGSPGTLIGSESTYRLRNLDAGMYIWYRVNPAALSGSTPGDSVWSNIIGPIGTFSANITGAASFCPGATMPITLSITGGGAPYTAVLGRSGSTSNKDTTISAISASPYIINVKIPGTYTLKSLTDNGGDAATVSSTSVILQMFPKVTAVLSGSGDICNDGNSVASLSLNFNAGTAPWTFVVSRLRSNGTLISDTTYTNVRSDPFPLVGRVISPFSSTLYRIKSLTDANNCPGDTTGSGTVRIYYKPSPVASISGIDSICPGGTGNLQVFLTGTAPWSITHLRNGANPTTITNITNRNYILQVPDVGTYTLSRVQDAVCSGKTSGRGIVRSYIVPTATISGSAAICEYTSANLNVVLTGTAPWKFKYRRNAETSVEIPNVSASPRIVSVQQAGTYILTEVYDKNCKGTVSGSAVINITKGPDVELSGLAAAYNKQSAEWISISGSPSGGTFIGAGVIPYNQSWYFVPSLLPVGTHTVVYAYRESTGSCYGYDTAVVRILEASAAIEFEHGRKNYCPKDHSFKITGVNLANDIGSFTISGGIGLVDHQNNTATIYPSMLNVGGYTITYTYFDGTNLSVTGRFDIGASPTADFKWETECYQTGKAIQLTNTSASSYGYLTDTSYHWKVLTSTGYIPYTTKDVTYDFAQPGIYKIELKVQSSYGCADSVTKEFNLRPTYKLADLTHSEDFADSPLEWQSGKSPETSVTSWLLGNPTKGFSGDKCWYTYISGTNAPREQSWVTSPCYDFTGTKRPMLKMQIWRLFNLDRDGATLQYSSDSSKTWNVLGEMDDGIHWYNDYQIDGKPGNQSLGWSNFNGSGNDNTWTEARHSLDVLKNKSSVQFRIAYGSDGTARNNNGFAFDDFWIGERNRIAILEHFTNSSDAVCDSVNVLINNFVNQNEMNVIDLQYHTSFPAEDPFNRHNPTVPGARVFYYGFTDVPYTVLNGGLKPTQRFDHDILKFNPTAVLVESLDDSKFWINLNSKLSGNTLNVEAHVFALKDIPATQLTIHIAVIERIIKADTGNDVETSFESVVKTLLPDAAGTTIYQEWKKDEPRYVKHSWELQHVYNKEELRVVAFVQDESTNEIYQAAFGIIDEIVQPGIDDLPGSHTGRPFKVYPNPAERTAYIEFDRINPEDITLELYNSLGSLVFVKQIPDGTLKGEISVEDYPDGLYILRLVSHDQLIGIRKLTISK